MPLWIPIGFGAVILWVAGNIIDKYLIEKYAHDKSDATDVNTLFMFSALFAVPTLILAAIMGGKWQTPLAVSLTALIAGLLFGLYLFLYLQALARSELSRVIPIFQSIPIFGFIFAYLLLGETLAPWQIVAGILIVLGSAVISYHHSESKFNLFSFLCILVGSAAIALQETLFKDAALSADYWTGTLWSSIGFLMFGVTIYLLRAPGRRAFNDIFLKRRFDIIRTNSLNEVLNVSASLVFSFATLLGPLVLVQSMNAYQPLLILAVAFIAQRIGITFLNEDMTAVSLFQKIAGIFLIFLGSLGLYFPLFV